MTDERHARDWVGPVLQKGRTTDAVVAAIQQLNQGVEIVDRGAYFRVLVLGLCRVTRQAIELHAGEPFRLPSDLEMIMSSFKGTLEISEDEAVWQLAKAAR